MAAKNGEKAQVKEGKCEESAQKGSFEDFYIVGVGASAGGLEALEQMFRDMPEDSGMAFVIVQHLSPDFRSLMDELLARYTRMPIHRVEDGMEVEPNSLYLIPPKQDMIISDGRLLLSEKDATQPLSLPIDHFFRSLAQDAGSRSVAVVLSGTGSDGSRGIRDVSEAGGLVIAQTVESAKFDGMPKSAIDTALVDVVVPPSEIPGILRRYVEHPVRSQLEPEEKQVDETTIERIFRLLQKRHKIDFNYYKPTTIGRRIERRIQLNHDGDIDEYLRRLESDDGEIDQLYKDLLIGVTRFFRDHQAFDTLRDEVLLPMLLSHKPSEEFRVWVAGCGTGEESYSLAILIDECMRSLDRSLNVKIFATDVHQASLDFAHAGVYPEVSLDEMSTERRDRYFKRTDAGYQILPEVRKMIVFAPHNLVKDAPFTHLHLITCRNLLIYLRTKAQKKVISLFHFGLKAGGVMFLGASESPGELADEFEVISERWKISRKKRDIRLPPDFRAPFGYHAPNHRTESAVPLQKSAIRDDRDLTSVYDQLLDEYMPSAVLVDDGCGVVQVFGGAGRFLRLADGQLSANLLDLVEGDLRLALTGALQKVAREQRDFTIDRVRANTTAGQRYVRVDVKPIESKTAGKRFLVTIHELEVAESERLTHAESLDLDEISRDQVAQLEQELRYTRESLQAAIEELETSNEELQATNEELVASNEELQSTNEELHSVNEELYTVNAEYQRKIVELTELTNDMDNLLVSTEVHTLFLDAKLCIRKFTPKMADVFNLVPHDVGRRIDAFAHNIECDDLTARVSRVLSTGARYEQNTKDNLGHDFLLRILPYRIGGRTSGVVLTLIDISSLVAAQGEILQAQERFERVIAANQDGVWDWPDVKKEAMWWSPACYKLLGYEPGEIPARYSTWLDLIHPDDQERVRQTSLPMQDKCYVDLHREFEYRMRHKSKGYRWYRHRAIVDYDAKGVPRRMTGSVGDIHERKCAEMRTKEEVRRRDSFLAMLSHELRNPMGAVLNAIECLLARPHDHHEGPTENGGGAAWLPSVGFQATQIIERQTRHMARLLDDLLDVARFGQGKIEFRKEVVDLRELVDDVLEATRHMLDKKDQILRVAIGEEPLRVFADPARMKQMQVNLLTNASKYTPDSGDIWYDIDRDGEEVLITVRDDGEGIPADFLQRVFDPFVQSNTTAARSAGGMGVGLSLTRSIVEAHDGTISAASDGPGKGSMFQIRLPATNKKNSAEAPLAPVSFEGCKLLLVEDNEDARSMLAQALQMQGFDVAVAGDGNTALELFPSFRPDVAVIDIGLPDMDGYQVARKVRANGDRSRIALIALTGYGREADRQDAIDAGFDAHLVKPLNPDDLYRQIASMGVVQQTTKEP
jgi:two-component system CheB/CheR fusion protein